MRVAGAFLLFALLLVSWLHAQGTPPGAPLTLVSREGRRPIATTMANGQELIALDDVAALFKVAVREDTLAGGLTGRRLWCMPPISRGFRGHRPQVDASTPLDRH